VLGQVASLLDREELDVASVQDEGWRLDQRQDGAHVDFQHGADERLGGPGVTLVRCIFANQRRNRASPARLGTSIAAMASVPHSWSNWARSASAASAGIPIG
jgi:hypothetical protein